MQQQQQQASRRHAVALDLCAFVSHAQLQHTQALVDVLLQQSSHVTLRTTAAAAAASGGNNRRAHPLKRVLDAIDTTSSTLCSATASVSSSSSSSSPAAAAALAATACARPRLCVRAVLLRSCGVVEGARLYRSCVHDVRCVLRATVAALTRAVTALFLPRCMTPHECAADYDIHVQLHPSSSSSSSLSARRRGRKTAAAAAVVGYTDAHVCAVMFVRRRSALRLRAAQQAALVQQYMRVAAPEQTLQSALQFWSSVSYTDDLVQQQQQQQYASHVLRNALPPLGLASAAQLADVDEQAVRAMQQQQQQREQQHTDNDDNDNKTTSAMQDDKDTGSNDSDKADADDVWRRGARKRHRAGVAAHDKTTVAGNNNNDAADDDDEDVNTTAIVLGSRDDGVADGNDKNSSDDDDGGGGGGRDVACVFCQPTVLLSTQLPHTTSRASAVATAVSSSSSATTTRRTAPVRYSKCGLVGVLYVTTHATAYVAYPATTHIAVEADDEGGAVMTRPVQSDTATVTTSNMDDDSNNKSNNSADADADALPHNTTTAAHPRVRVCRLPLDAASSFTRGLLGLS